VGCVYLDMASNSPKAKRRIPPGLLKMSNSMLTKRIAGNCWVDVFQGAELDGSLRRLWGPGRYRSVKGFGSMVVGDGVRVRLHMQNRTVEFTPRRGNVVPNLREIGVTGRVTSVEVIAIGSHDLARTVAA
jgi:hypothetical protein